MRVSVQIHDGAADADSSTGATGASVANVTLPGTAAALVPLAATGDERSTGPAGASAASMPSPSPAAASPVLQGSAGQSMSQSTGGAPAHDLLTGQHAVPEEQEEQHTDSSQSSGISQAQQPALLELRAPDPTTQRQQSKQACARYPNDALPVHFLHSAVANMLPLHSLLYADSHPGMLFSSKEHAFAAAATDAQDRFSGRFPANVDLAQQHGRRPHAVLWRLNVDVVEVTKSHMEEAQSEACAVLPYYTCSPLASQSHCSKNKADCPCVVSSALLADFRHSVSTGADAPLTELQRARLQMRWLPRDPFDGSVADLELSDTHVSVPRIIDTFNNRSVHMLAHCP